MNLILVGDFNVDVSNHFSPLLHKLSVISDSFSLDQIIQKVTHYSYSGSPSIIDLVFIPTSFQPCSYSILPPVSSSDHNAILFSLPFSSSVSPNPSASPRQVWVYDQANYQLANDLLSSVPLSDPESAWLIFKNVYLSIMHTTLPSKLVYPSPRFSAPWINGSLLSRIKFRNVIYRSPNIVLDLHPSGLFIAIFVIKLLLFSGHLNIDLFSLYLFLPILAHSGLLSTKFERSLFLFQLSCIMTYLPLHPKLKLMY